MSLRLISRYGAEMRPTFLSKAKTIGKEPIPGIVRTAPEGEPKWFRSVCGAHKNRPTVEIARSWLAVRRAAGDTVTAVVTENVRPIEPEVQRDFSRSMSYSGYLAAGHAAVRTAPGG